MGYGFGYGFLLYKLLLFVLGSLIFAGIFWSVYKKMILDKKKRKK